MFFKTLKTLFLLCIAVSVVFAGNNWSITDSKGSQPTLVGAPQGWSPTDEDSSIFFENFESGFGDWTTVDVTAPGFMWHPDDYNAYAGNSWWCGDSLIGGYDNHWLQYLVSPTLDFSTVSNPVLTFKMYYCVEDPAGTTAPYDGWDGCNVWQSTDDGVNWEVITPTFPAYDRQSLYSFGYEWGMGPDIPGWCGASGGPADTTWVDAQFSLSGAVGNSQVKIRFAFCSDPAYCTIGNPGIIGMFVDDVSIDDGATNLLSNNADDPPYPSEFTFDTGPTSGDWWIIDDQTYAPQSPSHCATCVIENHYNLSNALVTPWISLPVDFNIYYTFWLWCDMLDFSGGGGTTLEDYYIVEGTTDGVTWLKDEFGFHDYGDDHRPGGASVGWEEYLPSDPYNGNVYLDLTAYNGQDIKLRWRVTTDDNDDGGIGSGLHIDDFNVWVTTMLANDVGATALQIPFPTSLSNSTVTGTVTLYNFGSQNQSSVPAFARVDHSSIFPLAPWAIINSLESVEKQFSWNMAGVELGNHYWEAYTQLLSDEDHSNDTTSASYVTVTPEHIFELGYDARMYWVTSYLYFSHEPGGGPMCRFVPAEHDLPEPVDIVDAEILFHSTGYCTIHLFDAGTATSPGPELYNEYIFVNQTIPNWMTVDLTGVPEMADRTEPFWIWIESEDENTAQNCGNDAYFGEGHYFGYDGNSANPTDLYEFYIRVMALNEAAPLLELSADTVWFDSIAVGDTSRYFYTIYNLAEAGEMVVNDIVVNPISPNNTFWLTDTTIVPVTILAGDSLEFELLFVPILGLPSSYYATDMEIYCDGYPHYAEVPLRVCSPTGVEDKGGSYKPEVYALHQNYPNPFNPETTIRFSLAKAGHTTIRVYNTLGEEVAKLANGVMEAGLNAIVFDATAMASGIYFYTIESGDFKSVKKMVLMK